MKWDAAAGQWRADIWDRGALQPLGHFPDEAAAALAYDRCDDGVYGD